MLLVIEMIVKKQNRSFKNREEVVQNATQYVLDGNKLYL